MNIRQMPRHKQKIAEKLEEDFKGGKYSDEQIQLLIEITKVLGKYIFIDRNILQYRLAKKIGLSHIERAKKLNLLIEYKDPDALNSYFEKKDNQYFYRLGLAGEVLLEMENIFYNSFKISTPSQDKMKVLQFNYFAMENGLDLKTGSGLISDFNNYNYFHCEIENFNVIAYLNDYITEDELRDKVNLYEDITDKTISNIVFAKIYDTETSYNSSLKVENSKYSYNADQTRLENEKINIMDKEKLEEKRYVEEDEQTNAPLN